MVAESTVTEMKAVPRVIEESCPIVDAIKEIGGEWKLIVIRYLYEGPHGFNELLKKIPDSNSKTISSTLKYLEEHGIINREVESTRPFRVKYSLTPKGQSLDVALAELRKWGEKWITEPARQV